MAGWQAELSELAEEWPEPAEAADIPQTPEAAQFKSFKSTRQLSDTLNERPAIAEQHGTFVVKENASLTANKNIQQAAAAFKQNNTPSRNDKQGVGRDIFTPLRLQTMFEAPKTVSNAAKIHKQADLRNGSTAASPRLPTPPAMDAHAESIIDSRDFTFSCPRSRNSWKNQPHFLGHSRTKPALLSANTMELEFSNLENTPRHSTPTLSVRQDAHITPSRGPSFTAANKENAQLAAEEDGVERPLRLFQFVYDTYTRDHLEKLVDEIDGMTLSQQEQQRRLEGAVNSARARDEEEEELWEAYDRSDDDSTKPIPRAAKRIRLSPDHEQIQNVYGHQGPPRMGYSVPRSAVRDRIRDRRRSAADVQSQPVPADGPQSIAFSLSALPTSSSTVNSVQHNSQSTQRSLTATVSSTKSSTSAPLQQSSLRASNPISSRLAKAQALMDRIRSNAPDRSSSTSVDEQNSSSDSIRSNEVEEQDCFDGQQHGLDTVAEVTEEDFENSQEQDGRERLKNLKSAFSSTGSHPGTVPSQKGSTLTADDRKTVSSKGSSAITVMHISERPPLPHPWNAPQSKGTVKSTTPVSPESEKASSPAEPARLTAAQLNIRKSLAQDAPAVVQGRTASGSSNPSGRVFATEPTSAAALFGSASANANPAQPQSKPAEEPPKSVSRAGMLNIRPEEVTDVLKESSGKMVFDPVNQRWYKMSKQRLGIPTEQVAAADNQFEEGHSSEDDPFGDIESFDRGGDKNEEESEVSGAEDADEQDYKVNEIEGASLEMTDHSRDMSPEHTFTTETTLEYDAAPLALYNAAHARSKPSPKPRQKMPQPTLVATLNDRTSRPTHNGVQSSPPPARLAEEPRRSVLKGYGSESGTPDTALAKDRRSVSFSDLIHVPDHHEQEGNTSSPDAFTTQNGQPLPRQSNLRYELQPVHSGEEDNTTEETPSKMLGDGENRSWPNMLQTSLPASTSVLSANQTGDSHIQQSSLLAKQTKIRPKQAKTANTANTARRAMKESANSLVNATFLTECSFAVSHSKLIELITDVEPFEPCWEDLRTISLAGKNVEGLVRLNEFLPMLDEADLSDNNISYLTGLPGSLRTLLLRNNRLTSLTSFGHLRYLVRLDLSGNHLDSLHQLSCLVHLRDFRADNNQISSISGLSEIDGLLKLSLRHNALTSVDFDLTRWISLEALDLSHNVLTRVSGLEALSSCISLNLEHNQLSEITAKAQLPRLRILRVSYNPIFDFDASPFSHLRTLFIDSAKLGAIYNLDCLSKLESFSIRDQDGSKLQLPTYALRDLRRLYLSGNILPSSFRTNQYFNLTYVEMALCQISALPANFADLLPNCRFLNLSYNFLEDISALCGLTRLRHLSVVGSRLSKCRDLVATLQSMPELELIDLRLNPLTLSFYPPLPQSNSSRNEYCIAQSDCSNHQRSVHSSNTNHKWEEIDSRFKRNMPDLWYLRRIAYRNVLLQSCPRLKMIDGLRSEGKSARRQIADLLAKAQTTEGGRALMVQ